MLPVGVEAQEILLDGWNRGGEEEQKAPEFDMMQGPYDHG
jgi:hypothetical protein